MGRCNNRRAQERAAEARNIPSRARFSSFAVQLATLGPWSAKVIDLLRASALDGPPTLEAAARGLALSKRTLQARLKEEGTTFKALLDQVRTGLAKSYLRSSEFELIEIAFLLGYADQSAFQRAFKRCTGASPRAFRRQA